MLFVVRLPAGAHKQEAAREVRRELEALHIDTLNENDQNGVLQFAKAS